MVLSHVTTSSKALGFSYTCKRTLVNDRIVVSSPAAAVYTENSPFSLSSYKVSFVHAGQIVILSLVPAVLVPLHIFVFLTA